MSKITFRADDDLVEQLERLDVSKSEAMREALRAYLAADGPAGASQRAERERTSPPEQTGIIDDLIRDRIDELLTDRLADLELESDAGRRNSNAREKYQRDTGEITVSVSIPQASSGRSLEDDHRVSTRSTHHEERGETHARKHERDTDSADHSQADNQSSDEPATQCNQCGEHVDDDHVYCPNCGEKTSRRLFCDCGDEIRSDWAFCPGCGRRTPAADVLGRESPT